MISCKYMGTCLDPSGYGDANRTDICALIMAGVNVTVEAIKQMVEKADYGIEERICSHLIDRDINYKIKILHITPDLYPEYKEEGKYNIGRLFWETDILPQAWIEPCNQMDEIWTASDQMAEMIRKSGVKTLIKYFPEPINVLRGEENIEPIVTQFPKDYVFYSIFQWIHRKNPRALLRAYWKAFEGNDNVTLLLKTYRVNYSNNEYELIKSDIKNWKQELKQEHYPKIHLVKKLLTVNEISRLHSYGDCYINPSSGEGWCRPLQEAMLYGKPTISGDNGGITDVMSPYYYYQVPSFLKLATVSSHIPWYEENMRWKELDEDKLAEIMLEVYNNQNKSKSLGLKAQKFVKENFNFNAVGQKMKERLDEIEKGL